MTTALTVVPRFHEASQLQREIAANKTAAIIANNDDLWARAWGKGRRVKTVFHEHNAWTIGTCLYVLLRDTVLAASMPTVNPTKPNRELFDLRPDKPSTKLELIAWLNDQADRIGIFEHASNEPAGQRRLIAGKSYLCTARTFGA